MTGENGEKSFLFNTTGTYYAKITSPDWSKWSDPITISVLDLASVATTSNNNASNGGGSSAVNNENHVSANQIQNSVQRILNFLKSQQNDDGKIIDGGISEWSLMAFVSGGVNPNEIKMGNTSLLNYVKNYNLTDASELNICAGYPRHILTFYTAGLPTNDLVLEMKKRCFKNEIYGESTDIR